jgi:heme oxygenase
MTLQEKLKAATTTEHDDLEEKMFVGNIMSKTLSIAQYKQLLLTNYLIHANYETEIFSKIEASIAESLHLDERAKLGALEKDLVQAALPPATIVIPNYRNWTPWKALGAMYVLEGATMGGKVIYKQLLANPNFSKVNFKFNYYHCYGDQLMSKWTEFVTVLNTTDEAHHAEVIEGAKVMFAEIARMAETETKKGDMHDACPPLVHKN